MDIDYAKVAEAMGAKSYTVKRIEDLESAFAHAEKDRKEGHTVLIDAKISDARPIPVEKLVLDPRVHTLEDIEKFKVRYEAQNLRPFSEFLDAEGIEPVYKGESGGGF